MDDFDLEVQCEEMFEDVIVEDLVDFWDEYDYSA